MRGLDIGKQNKERTKYEILAEREADKLSQYDPEGTSYHKVTYTGETFQRMFPQLAKKYGLTGRGRELLVPYNADSPGKLLDSVSISKIPIKNIAQELRGERKPEHVRKLDVPPVKEIIKSNKLQIIAQVNPENKDDSMYDGNRFTDVSFMEYDPVTDTRSPLNPTPGSNKFTNKSGRWQDDFKAAYAQPMVDFTSSDGQRIYGGIDSLMEVFGDTPRLSTIHKQNQMKKTSKPITYMYGGEVKKYQTGGNIVANQAQTNMSSNLLDNSNIGQTTDVGGDMEFMEFGKNEVNLDTQGNQAGSFTNYLDTGVEIYGSIASGIKGTKEFYKDSDDSIDYNVKDATKDFKDARGDKAEGIGNAVGTAVGSFFLGPQAGKAIGKATGFLAEQGSKLFGVGKKAKAHMDEELGESMDYNQREDREAVLAEKTAERQGNISNYLKEVSNPQGYAELGGMLYGNSHADGGIMIEAEGGEFITKKSAMSDNSKKTITGTNKQIVSKINAIAGGKNPFPGGKINKYA
tara:strand:+ start:2046 stop:3599 length:1554 start_codon:yes stop_codon:yes gene_type:complete